MTIRHIFTQGEFRYRLQRAQQLINQHNAAALLLTTEPEFRYFTGFLTRFWESPTRPWYLVIPASGKPIAVIPSIGEPLLKRCNSVDDIRTWASPCPEDEGITLLTSSLYEIAGKNGEIITPQGPETSLRMPLQDFRKLQKLLGREIGNDYGITHTLRQIKSTAEIACIKQSCEVGDRAFARIGEIAKVGVPLATIFRHFQILCLEEGADWVPYLAGACSPNGYADVISPASDQPVAPGEVLMLDTGLMKDGYFCDFDRNYCFGKPNQLLVDANKKVHEAVDAGFAVARPGASTTEVFNAMSRVSGASSNVARAGHGLGMQLTELPSLTATDNTLLEAGMVITLEPSVLTEAGKFIVHEENIVICEQGAEYLSTRTSGAMMEL